MIQLILHLLGDYVTQSDWMAKRKTESSFAAGTHALIYSLPFLAIGSAKAFVVIAGSHFLIDRFRLARYVVFAKNHLGWPLPKWSDCSATGYPSSMPPFLAIWLMIAADNTIHLACNYLALKFL